MSTLTISVRSNRTQADLVSLYKVSASNPREAALGLSAYLRAIAGGMENGSIRLQTGSANPVAASATATISFAAIVATDTIVIAGITLTCVASGATSVQFNRQTDDTTTAANLVAAINALSTLNIYVTATSALGVVTITSLHTGATANLVTISKTGTGITLSGSTLAGGSGVNDVPFLYSLGI